MYLTQCECRDGERERERKAVTAIPCEMINKFYYYLSSLKVAANTLQRIMYRIPTLTCRHARFSQKANSSKPVNTLESSERREQTTKTHKNEREGERETEAKRERKKLRGKNHLPIHISHRGSNEYDSEYQFASDGIYFYLYTLGSLSLSGSLVHRMGVRAFVCA